LQKEGEGETPNKTVDLLLESKIISNEREPKKQAIVGGHQSGKKRRAEEEVYSTVYMAADNWKNRIKVARDQWGRN